MNKYEKRRLKLAAIMAILVGVICFTSLKDATILVSTLIFIVGFILIF